MPLCLGSKLKGQVVSDGVGTDPRLEDLDKNPVVLEACERFYGLSRINLGDTILEAGTREAFGTTHFTKEVRNFTLRDVTLHASTMMLFQGARKLPETRYLVTDRDYAAARVDDVVSIGGDGPIVLGFNKSYPGYYHWIVQCLPAIDAALCRDIYPGARLALPKLDGWHAELLDLLGYGDVDRIEIDRDRCYALPCAIYSEHLNGSTVPCVSRTAVQTFQRLRKRARVPPTPREAIYVARTDTSRRPMRNEDQLMRLLENEGVAIVVGCPSPSRLPRSTAQRSSSGRMAAG